MLLFIKTIITPFRVTSGEQKENPIRTIDTTVNPRSAGDRWLARAPPVLPGQVRRAHVATNKHTHKQADMRSSAQFAVLFACVAYGEFKMEIIT